MQKFLYISFILLVVLRASAQPLTIQWGIDNPRNSPIVQILPDKGTDFYVFRQSSNQLLSTPKVTRFTNGAALMTKKIAQHIENNMVSLEQLVTFQHNLIGFLSDKKDGSNNLYLVTYDTEMDPFGEPRLISSYPMPKGWNNKGGFNVLTSKNNKFLAVEYIIPGKRDLYDRYGYKVLDSTLKEVSSGEYELPYTRRDAEVDTRHLTNEGDYIIGISVYKNANRFIWKDYNALEKTVIVHVKENTFKEYSLDILDKRVFDYGITSLNNRIIITGTYGQPNAAGSQGVFMQQIDLIQERILNEHFDLFPRDFMNENMTTEQIERMERREARGRLGPQLVNYAIRDIHPMEDKSTIVVAEQFYVFQQSSTDSRGVTQTVYHYYFNDIVAYKVDSSGTFNWIKRLPKEQHSVNDYGYFCSLKTVISGGKLLCFFNDNKSNYDDFGNYEGFYRSISFPARKKSYVLALGEVDLSTGEVKRRIFNTFAETNGIVVLKLSVPDFKNKQLVFFSQGRKERFGVLNY